MANEAIEDIANSVYKYTGRARGPKLRIHTHAHIQMNSHIHSLIQIHLPKILSERYWFTASAYFIICARKCVCL